MKLQNARPMPRSILVTTAVVGAVVLASALAIAQQQSQLDSSRTDELAQLIEPQSHEFADVPTESPFHPFVSWLVARGITGGCAPGLFCPDAPVTRAQMAVFLKANSLKGSPLAFGVVVWTGNNAVVGSGSGNFMVAWNATTHWFEITIANHPYSAQSYTTTVTPTGTDDCWGLIPVVDSSNNKLVVQLTDSWRGFYACHFNFVTYFNGN